MDALWRAVDDHHGGLLPDGGAPLDLAIAPAGLARLCWPGGTPRPIDLERAIDAVEGAIEQAGLHHAARGCLWLDDSLTAELSGVLPGLVAGGLDRGGVEAAFSDLVARVQGGRPLAIGPTAAAALLVLRELLHHGGFARARNARAVGG